MAEVRNPLFARLYGRVAAQLEAKGNAEHRRELLAELEGRIVELGAGTGLNFAHYPSTVTEVVAVEPESYLRTKAAAAAGTAQVRITVVDGVADDLPGDDGSFDAGVVSLVLCSVPDPAVALAELRRVIRPGGELRFFEHIRSDHPKLARWQDRVDPVWPHIGGGCHANRRTVDAIEAAGFDIEHERRFTFRPSPVMTITSPHAIGDARRPNP